MRRGVERVTLTCITENYVDMLLPDQPGVMRAGLRHHFDPKRLCPVAENGIALHVDVEWGPYRYRVLFDTGLTGDVLQHNSKALGLDLSLVDHVVLSHGHPDHYGGLTGFLAKQDVPVPISVHPDAFLPRYLRIASGEIAPYYNSDLSAEMIWAAKGRPVIHNGPLEVGPGLVATGEINRQVDFEAPNREISSPNALIQLVEGQMEPDIVKDDQALIIEIGADGMIILVGCSHAGVINTIRHAVHVTGRQRIIGVFGGFHLGFPGVPSAKTDRTIEELRDMEVEVICPMHCTGMRAIMDIASALPDSFVMNCTGARVSFDGAGNRAESRRTRELTAAVSRLEG